MKGPAYRVLYNSGEVHACIQNLFKGADTSHRRVALVAYVGKDGRTFLPDPRGAYIICCPTPGATSYVGISQLMKDGARVEFSKNLHMKIYWSKGRGCLITSANLSTNALGARGLKEAGVLLDDANVDIDRLITEARPYAPTPSQLKTFKKDDIKARGTFAMLFRDHDPLQTYTDWFGSRRYTPWKLGLWTTRSLDFAKSAKEKSLTMGIVEPHECINVRQGRTHEHEWLLLFTIRNEQLLDLSWMYVDFVVPVGSRERGAYEKDYPFQAVQARRQGQCPTPPFTLSAAFKNAFGKAARSYGITKLTERDSLVPPEKLLSEAAGFMSKDAATTNRLRQRRPKGASTRRGANVIRKARSAAGG
jgi:hypothetical protein